METFQTKKSEISKLFLRVDTDFKNIARTWITKEESNSETPKKTLIKDSKPGNGNIDFVEAGDTITYKNLNLLVITTNFHFQKAGSNPPKIKYYLIEDDDIPGDFFESKIFESNSTEMVFSPSKDIVRITKIIKIL
jgi:hypothetical protein